MRAWRPRAKARRSLLVTRVAEGPGIYPGRSPAGKGVFADEWALYDLSRQCPAGTPRYFEVFTEQRRCNGAVVPIFSHVLTLRLRLRSREKIAMQRLGFSFCSAGGRRVCGKPAAVWSGHQKSAGPRTDRVAPRYK